ncbi:DUF4142 domain-containing protein [Chitinophaga japonensis]|uniref:Putative membrane protein n=1 Tax=Chitinophaga japonensis TaxID=104662 RepID=A0A562T0R9_CHIJA|nr:DUF4142 domain-containing protein [Chitinophaga japonensis]TWI86580.1 putative membrane protein [Chitinophaga japonensis]
MKLFSRLYLAASLVWVLQSCGGAGRNDNVDSVQALNDSLASVDDAAAEFAVDAANGGMMEVQLGGMAQEKARSQRVKDFGNMMVRDHSSANDELKNLAVSKNIALPDSVGADKREHIEELSRKTGREFDEAYIDMMVKDHEKDVNEFEKAASNLSDPDLKAFASRTLPTLRMHLDSAKAIQEAQRKMMNNSDRPGAVGK